MPHSPIYQTLEDRYNADKVEQFGPFKCKQENAWLGSGYYFWDYHIELGHWWGRTSYGKDKYMICRGLCDVRSEKCWDLHDNGKHRIEFKQAVDLLIKYKVAPINKITVPQVIQYARKKGMFKYEAIRIYGINSATAPNPSSNDIVDVGTQFLFNRKNIKAYFEPLPVIQVCLLTKKSLAFRNFQVVWPDHYYEEIVF